MKLGGGPLHRYIVKCYYFLTDCLFLLCRKLSNCDRQYIFEVCMVVLGAWFGTIPFILDWDRQWQVCLFAIVEVLFI